MRVDEVSVKKFGQHMTFAPRFGWLKKAFDGVSKNPEIFGHDDAPKQLGVGKNMVDAIAFWATACPNISGFLETPSNAFFSQPNLGAKVMCWPNFFTETSSTLMLIEP